MLEANTSAASVMRCLIAGSSAKRAITIFVSSRNLPLAKIHRFTAFFNRIAHSLKIVGRYAAGEPEEIGTRNSMWFNFGELASEIQHALLLCLRKPMKQFRNFLINGRHGILASFFEVYNGRLFRRLSVSPEPQPRNLTLTSVICTGDDNASVRQPSSVSVFGLVAV